MSKTDSLKEKIANRRETYKNLFVILIATLSGSFTILYKVIIQEATEILLFLFVSGLIASIFLTLILVKIYKDMENLSEELENE